MTQKIVKLWMHMQHLRLSYSYEQRVRAVSQENLSLGFSTRYNTNRAVQPQNRRLEASNLEEVEGLYY